MLTRPGLKLNYSVTIDFLDELSLTSVGAVANLSFTSVSGGETSFDTVDEHINHNSNIKYSATGRGSVGDVTLEMGSYSTTTVGGQEQITSSQFLNLIQKYQSSYNRINLTVNKILLSDGGTPPTEYQAITYQNCVISSFLVGEFNSTSEEIIMQRLVVKPSGMKIQDGELKPIEL